MVSPRSFYPFLFAVIPVLNVVSRNPGYAEPGDILATTGFVLAGTLVLYILLALIVRQPLDHIALLVFAVVFWFYASVPAAVSLRAYAGRLGAVALVTLVVAASLWLVWWLGRRPERLVRVGSFLSLTGLLLGGWLSAHIVADLIRARTAVRESALARQLSQPVPTAASFRAADPLPDVYLIVLDEYANAAVLRERFDFDNRMFEDSLRQLGFTVPVAVRSNYAHTILSLPSLLNFSHLTGLTRELGPGTTDPTLPDYLLEHNRTVPFLKSRGYRFLLFPSQWWPATRHSAYADQELRVWRGLDFGRELTRTHFRRSLTRMTPLGQLFREPPYDGEHIKRTLEALKAVPARAEPTFVFAHVMSPHYPYVFQADCRSVPPRGASHKRVAYVNQLRCLNRMILGVVTALLQGSASDPIIILQGDHGTSTLNFSWAPTAARVSPEQARERFGAFGAYHLPGGGRRLLGDTVTVVNVMQKVLSFYFGADVPPMENELYMSIERRPYDFVRVDPITWATSTPPPRSGTRVGAGR